jgi:hypothetical protein
MGYGKYQPSVFGVKGFSVYYDAKGNFLATEPPLEIGSELKVGGKIWYVSGTDTDREGRRKCYCRLRM